MCSPVIEHCRIQCTGKYLEGAPFWRWKQAAQATGGILAVKGQIRF